MANNPSTLPKYNGQTAAPDADYTYGSARDDAAAGDLTGTPRIAAEVNDIMGFQQALLVSTGVVPSGTPDKVTESQYLEALGKRNSVSKATIADMTADTTLRAGMIILVDEYYTGIESGPMFFKVVTGAAGAPDGGSQIDHDTLGIHFVQNFKDGSGSVRQFGAKVDNSTDDTAAFQAAIDYGNSKFLGGGLGGGGFDVLLSEGLMKYTGVEVKQGVNLIGQGPAVCGILLGGGTATGLKCEAADTGLVADQVSRGRFKGFAMWSDEAAPTAQIQWDMTGFSRWVMDDVLIEWFGGCTGISCVGSVLAGSGGPAQWYNLFTHIFLLNPASRPVGGIAANLGDTAATSEQVTAMTWLAGRISAAGTGTGLALRGTGNSFHGTTFEGLDTACDIGSTGTRGASSNVFHGCYWEGNTENRKIRANASETQFFGSFLTGGVDDDQSTSTSFIDGSIFSTKAGSTGIRKWEVEMTDGSIRRPNFKGSTAPGIDLTNSASTDLTLQNSSAGGSATQFFRIAWNSLATVLYSFGTTEFTAGADGVVNVGSAANRMNTVYAAVGSINTSDERSKTELLDLDAAESAAAVDLKKAIKKFKFKDAVESKGEDKARIHVGVGAQTVKDIFESHKLDPTKYAMFCHDTWDDVFETLDAEVNEEGVIIKEERTILRQKAGDRFGIRYDELLAFIIAGL